MHTHTNRLIRETSPYLLQHAHNPVDWYPWGDEALQKAKKENKPILISIGYSSCHWCHVMERESFEDEDTARIMNENFINIKIDREERPDLDSIYMEAVQIMTGSGGWPLNVFLTPDGKPFFGGTYFPPKHSYNRHSWQEILQSVSLAFQKRRNIIDSQAESLAEHMSKADLPEMNSDQEAGEIFKRENTDKLFMKIMELADKEWGGFGEAPKFPQSLTLLYLLRYSHITGNQESLSQALLSLDKMIEGGIYDQIGGGFARYSTDNEWLAPHFEKMLYDNALLIWVLSEAFQITGKERYREVINETMQLILRDLYSEEGGFYCALDADSEGKEGKYYVWDYDELTDLLGNDAAIFCEFYDVSRQGNWEGKNILRVKESIKSFSERKGSDAKTLSRLLKKCGEKLLRERKKRISPGKDDKIIMNWNALMNSACSKAYIATANENYRQLAIRNMDFLLNRFSVGKGKEINHSWKNGKGKVPAFLDDYAFLIHALIDLQKITADNGYLITAKEFTGYVLQNFADELSPMFFYTKKDQADLIARKKEFYDEALPSGNSMMAYVLYHLSVLFEKDEWKQKSIDMITSINGFLMKYPVSFSLWAGLFLEITTGSDEIVVVGQGASELHNQILKYYIPHGIMISSQSADPEFPSLADKRVSNEALIYLCRDFSCLPPVKSTIDLISLINRPEKGINNF